MILPTLLVILGATFYPIAVSLLNSFCLSLPGQPGGEWAGLQNYVYLFWDKPFQAVLVNTASYRGERGLG